MPTPTSRPATRRSSSHTLIERHAIARMWAEFQAEHPLLVLPVWNQPPFPHGWDMASFDNAVATLDIIRPVLPANLLGLPAAVVPGGLSEGLAGRGAGRRQPLPRGSRPRCRRRHRARRGRAHADRSGHGRSGPGRSGPRRPGRVTRSGLPGRGLPGRRLTVRRLVALALPGGPAFVDALRRVWDDGDAALPLDLRLPAPARAAVLEALAPAAIVDEQGDVVTPRRRSPGRAGRRAGGGHQRDDWRPQGCRAHPRCRRGPRPRPPAPGSASPPTTTGWRAFPWPTSEGSRS